LKEKAAALPETLINQLHDATLSADLDRVLELIHQIEKHDVNVGGKTELLPAVSTEGHDGDKFLLGVLQRAEHCGDQAVKPLRQCQRDPESARALTMEFHNRLQLASKYVLT